MKKTLSILMLLALIFVSMPAFAQVSGNDAPPGDSTPVTGSQSSDLPPADTTPVDQSQPAAPTTPTTPSNEGGVPPGGLSSSGGTSGGFPITTTGQVLGATTESDGVTCKPFIVTYMKFGAANNAADVMVLQALLNKELNISLAVNGVFGLETFNAVKAFQVKYSTDVLVPWVNVGGLPNANVGTGYVYKTTLRKVNLLLCPTANIPMPALR